MKNWGYMVRCKTRRRRGWTYFLKSRRSGFKTKAQARKRAGQLRTSGHKTCRVMKIH